MRISAACEGAIGENSTRVRFNGACGNPSVCGGVKKQELFEAGDGWLENKMERHTARRCNWAAVTQARSGQMTCEGAEFVDMGEASGQTKPVKILRLIIL